MTATLDDDDGIPDTITWEWTVNRGSPAGTGVDSREYSPAVADEDKILRVKATYEEDGDDKVVAPVSAGQVRSAPTDNVPPDFNPNTANRRVDENVRAGARLGDPVGATDADTLTYTVNNDNFGVSSSGQLTTAAMLDHETAATVEVEVTATDPWGSSATLTYTVTVVDKNEAPMVAMGITRRDHDENTVTTGDDGLIDTYVALDVDDGDTAAVLTWTVEGEDTAMFEMGETDGMLQIQGIAQLRDADGPQQGQRLQGDGRGVRRWRPETDGQAAGRNHRNRHGGRRRGNAVRRPAQGGHRPQGVPHRPRQRHIRKRRRQHRRRCEVAVVANSRHC